MSETKTPDNLKYTTTHEWARLESNGLVTVGITEHAQDLLGDIVFIDLPELQLKKEKGAEASVIESVKAASDIYFPVGGSVASVNDALLANPELVNSDPYGKGWIFCIQPNNVNDFNSLMDAKQYAQQITNKD